MNKVYCVFSGAYSDRSLHAVFSSYDKAMEYIKIQKAFFDREVDDEPIEYDMDKPNDISTVVYSVTVVKDDFNGSYSISDVKPNNDWYQYDEDISEEPCDTYTAQDGFTYLNVKVNFNPDYSVMEKAVRDKVMSYLANKEGM